MKTTRLFIGGVVFLISGIVLIVHTYSNVLPQISENHTPPSFSPEVDTVYIADTSTSPNERFVCSVYFSSGSAYLPYREEQKLINSISGFTQTESYQFRIDGFADPTGSGTVDNNRIALNRSYSVYSSLRKQGIAKENLLMRSFGASQSSSLAIDSLRKVDITAIGGVH